MARLRELAAVLLGACLVPVLLIVALRLARRMDDDPDLAD